MVCLCLSYQIIGDFMYNLNLSLCQLLLQLPLKWTESEDFHPCYFFTKKKLQLFLLLLMLLKLFLLFLRWKDFRKNFNFTFFFLENFDDKKPHIPLRMSCTRRTLMMFKGRGIVQKNSIVNLGQIRTRPWNECLFFGQVHIKMFRK